MRWVLGVASLLVAMAVVLVLASSQGGRSVATLGAGTRLLTEPVAPRPFDDSEAMGLLTTMEGWTDLPAPPEAGLRDAARTASAWVAGADPGGPRHRAAVKLRGAALALLGPGGDARSPQRQEARRLLAEARRSLSDPNAPQGAVEGLRNQLENLQHGQRERLQEAERSLR